MCIRDSIGSFYHATAERRKGGRRHEALCVPELPDIAAYITALEERIVGQPLERICMVNPFVLRTQEPPAALLQGRSVRELRRIGTVSYTHLDVYKRQVTNWVTVAVALLVFAATMRTRLNPALLILGGAVVGAVALR